MTAVSFSTSQRLCRSLGCALSPIGSSALPGCSPSGCSPNLNMVTAASVSAAERCSWSNSSSISSDGDQEEPAGGQVNRVLAMYHDATVLITGGTGFLGKVLLEKALRCLNVRKIFLLIRRKDNLSARDRLVRLLQDPVRGRGVVISIRPTIASPEWFETFPIT